LSEALAGRVAGVSVLRSSGVTGSGSRVRIRGGSGLVIPREPLLVVDGVRVDNSQSSLGIDVGGQHPSRLDDLPLDDIERIDVLRGPAATALYGTDAAGGVIAVTTRQGRAGPMRWHGYAESGLTSEPTEYPTNTATGPPTYGAETCTRAGAALGQCTPGPLSRWNPLEQASPFRTGTRWAGGASASGGTRTVRFVAGGTASSDQGVLAPNDSRRYSSRVNVDVTPLPALRVALRASHLASGTTFPLGDVFPSSTLYSGLMGNTADDPVRRGYLGIAPASLATAVTKQQLTRSFGSGAAEWTPLRWLTARGLIGREIVRRDDSRTFPMAVAYLDPTREGPFRIEGSTGRDKHTTLAGSMTADFAIAGPVRGSTTVGSERLTRSLRTRDSLIGFFEDGRQAGFSLRVSREPRKVVGLFATQRLAWSSRVLDLGVRRDGRDRWLLTRPTTYYSGAASWIVSDERFFHPNMAVSQLRLHGAYGLGGDSRALRVALESAPVRPPPVGEPPPLPSFRPERVSEMELGAEIWSLYGRVKAHATWYRQRSTNALERGCCLGPLGYDDGAGWRTDGVELTIASKLVQTLATDWDAQLTFATVSNTYDRSRSGQPRTLDGSPFFGGARRRLVRGYPIAGIWGHPVTGRDANGDGVIVPSEATEATDSVYLGSIHPDARGRTGDDDRPRPEARDALGPG
jgi:TonB-dependent SusC/RagA subfamily outer membrane receptor